MFRLVYNEYLPCLELNFNLLITNSFSEREDNTIFLLSKCEAGLIEVGLNVIELRVVLIFVLDFLVKCLCQLLDALLNCSSVSGERS
jgi:hypothetical protein